MQAGVFFLLLIGAVNLINLFLIRASDRAKEMAIRQSMGANRGHVVRQVVTETVLLTSTGGLLGVWRWRVGNSICSRSSARIVCRSARISRSMDGSHRLVSSALWFLESIIAMPIVWFNLRTHLANALQSESRTGTISRATQRLRHGFIVAQIALAFVLLAGAALLGLSLKKAMAVSPGFRSDHVLTGECTVSWDLQRERVGIVDRLLESIRQQPGIAATGTITNIPLSGDSGKTAVTPKGYVPPPGQSVHGHYSYAVHGDYFSALGIHLREGRFLTSADSHRAERVCVVDEDLARRYWPNGGALGQRIALGDEKDDATSVYSCRRRRRSEASRAHRSAGTRRGLPALRVSRQRQYFHRRRARASARKRSPRRCASWCAQRIPHSRSITSARWIRASRTA